MTAAEALREIRELLERNLRIRQTSFEFTRYFDQPSDVLAIVDRIVEKHRLEGERA